MSTSAPKSGAGAPESTPKITADETVRVEPKKSDVVLTIKVILIAVASIAALWMLDRFVSG